MNQLIAYRCPRCGCVLGTRCPAAAGTEDSIRQCASCDHIHFLVIEQYENGEIFLQTRMQVTPCPLIKVVDKNNTFIASHGQQRASCTAGVWQAAERLAQKITGNDAAALVPAHHIQPKPGISWFAVVEGD